MDSLYGPERSITSYVATEHDRPPSTEGALTAWAVLALLFVVATILIGGCA